MRLRWLSVLFVVLTLFLSAIPVQAAIITIRPTQTPQIIPSQADFDKITRLQAQTALEVLTPVSPDDQSMLIVSQSPSGRVKFEFLNVQDGSTAPVSRDILGFSPLTNMVWLDDDTVGYYSAAYDDSGEPGSSSDKIIEVLVRIDRASGEVAYEPVDLPGLPYSLSPNGSKILLVRNNLKDLFVYSNGALQYRSPFNQVIHRGFSNSSQEQAAASPELTGWLKFLNPNERRKLGDFAIGNDLDIALSSIVITLEAFDIENGKVLPLGDLAPRSDLADITWSADSSHLAISHITVLDDPRGGSLLSEVQVQDALGNLPAAKNPFLQGNLVDTVDFNTGQVTKELLRGSGGNGDLYTGLSWNSDGSILAVHMEKPGRPAGRVNPTYLYTERSYIRFYSPDGELLSTLDKPEIEDPIYSVPEFISKDELLVNAVRGMSDRVFYFNLTSGEFRQLPIADGVATAVRPTHQSRQIVFGFSSFNQAPELMRINMDGQALYRLTFLNEDLSVYGRVRADQVSFTLSSGQVRTGYLLQSPDATFSPTPRRMVVWQEGGPTAPMLNQWGTITERPFDLLPHFGMSVLVVPLPGRYGFGAAFLNGLADNANFGQIDINEQAEIVRQSISRGYTKAGSVGVTGCSYGGYFASQSIVSYPDLYAAANSQCTLLDLFNEWQLGFTAYMSYLEGRVPTVDPVEYLKDSPFYHAATIKTPLLLFDGLRDFLPVEAVGNFHDQVQANGAAVNLLVFSAAGHGLASVHDEIIADQAQIAWFQQFLPDPNPTAAPVSFQSGLWDKFARALKQ
jgi:dipeptidyl aminopeptidase/acylaminoacyl peptidase